MAPDSLTAETERPPSDNITNGGRGGGSDVPSGLGHDIVELEPEHRATPASAYRLVTFLAMIWITALFATLTIVLESRWVHSPNWVSIELPQILYVNAAILLLSSVTIELARLSLQAMRSKRCARWILVTLSMGFMVLFGQAFAWRELSLRGLHLASNPGSFFLYLMTGTHAIHLLGGIAVLTSIGFQISRATQKGKLQGAMDIIALYWHFTDGLWLYVVALLFFSIQQ
jgi:cytochrome c oxidase subunit III